MFGFRNANARRRVHSNKKHDEPDHDSSESHSPQSQCSFQYHYDDDSSVDLSLYTTQSKSTVRYPAARFMNYRHQQDTKDDQDCDDLSNDGVSCAPSEFTTEIALNQYMRLGAAWRPPEPLHSPESLKESNFLDPGTSHTRPEKPSILASQTGSEPHARKESLSSTVGCGGNDCDASTFSVLPATAKMAQITFQDQRPARTNNDSKPPLIQSSSNLEANTSNCGEEVSPLPETSVQSSSGPVDLDESVADSASVSSSSTSRENPSMDLPMAETQLVGQCVALGKTSTQAQEMSLNDSESNAEPEDSRDDDTYGFSVSASRMASLRGELNTMSQKDDDSYGFSITSQSVSTGQSSSGSGLQAPRGESLRQWDENPYRSAGRLGTARPLPQQRQYSEESLTLNYSTDSCPEISLLGYGMRSPTSSSQSSGNSEQGRDAVSPFKNKSSPPSSPNATTSDCDSSSPLENSSSPSSIVSRSAESVWIANCESPRRASPKANSATLPENYLAESKEIAALSPITLHATPPRSSPTSQSSDLVVSPDSRDQSTISALTPAILERTDDDTYGFSTTSVASVPRLNASSGGYLPGSCLPEDDDGVHIWTDLADIEEDDAVFQPKQKIRREDVIRTYRETMKSISFARRSYDSLHGIDEESPKEKISGSVLLTAAELRKHLKKVQYHDPLPSSELDGYDTWRQRKEQQQVYFAKLQAKQAREKLALQKQRNHLKSSQNIHRDAVVSDQKSQMPIMTNASRSFEGKGLDSTRSAMDHSMNSSIPTVDDGKLNPKQKKKFGLRRGWGCFLLGLKKNSKKYSERSSSASSDKKKSKKKRTEKPIVPLSQFMRISNDEPLYVAEYSLSPLHKDGVATLGTSTYPDGGNTTTATRSHYMDGPDFGVRAMAAAYLEEQRQKHSIPSSYSKKEQKILGPRKDDIKLGDATSQTKEDSVVEKCISVSSKHSAASSMQTGSGQILSPCVICKAAERSHIAVPCMHFYFCGECAQRLCEKECPASCPVCSTLGVTFSRVYTG